MPTTFDEVCCARIPRDALGRLAGLRIEPGLRVCLAEQHAWLRWDAGNARVLAVVMPIHEALLFRFHAGRWHRVGEALPDFAFPVEQRYQPLAHVLFPMPVQPLPAPAKPAAPFRLTLERDDSPRATTALRCTLDALLAWSDTVGTERLARLDGVVQREQMLILGSELPLLDNAERYWGQDVRMPIGYAPNVALSETMMRAAMRVSDDELLVWAPNRTMNIARGLFTPLTRAGLRLARREARR